MTDPFGCRCLNSRTLLRFHVPLIEPDGRISRIRLSDKDSGLRPRAGRGQRLQMEQVQDLVQVRVGEGANVPRQA